MREKGIEKKLINESFCMLLREGRREWLDQQKRENKQEERLTRCGAGANSGNETREPVHFHLDLIIGRRREPKKRKTLLIREMVLDLPPGDIIDMDHNVGC